ncbi:MAG: BLUF domain-containing protein [Anaerolineae bacterium]
MALISLVYVSVASGYMTNKVLKDILEASRENNAKLGITGMLLYRDQYFVQALEGEEAQVMALYEKIKDDPRHHHVLTVYQAEVSRRTFGEWSMGFNLLDKEHAGHIEGFNDFLVKPSHEFFTQEPNRVVLLLESFRDRSYW